MSNNILAVAGSLTALTITITGVTTGTGRQSTMVDNSVTQARRAIIYTHVKTNSAPTAGSTYDFYLIRFDKGSSPTYGSDNAGASDAVWTQANALYLGSIVLTASATTTFYGEFDTADVTSDLGPGWALGFMNRSGQTPSTTGGDHLFEYATIIDQVQ